LLLPFHSCDDVIIFAKLALVAARASMNAGSSGGDGIACAHPILSRIVRISACLKWIVRIDALGHWRKHVGIFDWT
jgi:hypothetical protein